MWNKKCPSCAKKVDKKFSYCPWCGLGFKKIKEEENFGLLGRDDLADVPKIGMPFNLDKLMMPLVKQLTEQFEKEISANSPKGMPGGFKIQISTGPQPKKAVQEKQQIIAVSENEMERRRSLPRKDAESNVRRLSDKVVYEVHVPGVNSKEDIIINKLENGIEIRAYSKDVCYVKTIPLNVDVLGYRIKDGTLFLELKS